MNTYGNLPPSLRRVIAYQGVECAHAPGFADNAYRITLHEQGCSVVDVFIVENDGDANRAINLLHSRALSLLAESNLPEH